MRKKDKSVLRRKEIKIYMREKHKGGKCIRVNKGEPG